MITRRVSDPGSPRDMVTEFLAFEIHGMLLNNHSGINFVISPNVVSFHKCINNNLCTVNNIIISANILYIGRGGEGGSEVAFS